ncbi:signal transduction histidine kinase [Nocardioides albertanoniae]|uniref:Sensor-like histidine kinase SenX3 n=1 Tax=Nocardioides albertanoniae TaxID=1175486 RepID=A0A543A2Q4_9ACTN|nr:HAMP domain-containing sensor histidine kinase [Nocardioides albertanoniae]TQL66878.1 signal transduction histidine kinase [Nocardioides albertanoniae]
MADPALQMIAEGICELLGFGIAVVNVVRGDQLEVVALNGMISALNANGERETAEEILGTRWALSDLRDNLARGENWGAWRFVPHERVNLHEGTWIATTNMINASDAWHPHDMLIAPILDDDGEIRGCLSVDMPISGHRPDFTHRRVLNRFAKRAQRVVLGYLEREQLFERAANLETAKEFLRDASSKLSLAEVLDASHDALIRGLDADGIWMATKGPGRRMVVHSTPGLNWDPDPALAALTSRNSARYWAEGTYSIQRRQRITDSSEWNDQAAVADKFFETLGAESALVVPVGADYEWLGHIVLLRSPGRPTWSDAEGRLALELGRDFGRIVLTANAYTQERDLAQQLADADRERNRLIEAVARELRIPVTALGTSLNALGSEHVNTLQWIVQVETLTARSAQIEGIVGDLLLLSRVADPANAPGETTIEVSEMLDDVLDELDPDGARKDIECVLTTPTGPAYVRGDPRELRAAFLHLVKNALTYSHRGSRVNVTLYSAGNEVTIIVADAGVGIDLEEHSKVFDAFYRGSNSALGGSRGAGLGMTLVEQITRRHQGLVELDSSPGNGTRVALTLPGVG